MQRIIRIVSILGAFFMATAALTALPACDGNGSEGEGEGEGE